MDNPNSDAAKGVEQGAATPDMTQEYDKRHGMYDGGLSKTNDKPAAPSSMPNQPSPMTGLK